MRVRDVMSEEVIAVRPEIPLKEVAAVLSRCAISGVPVIDADDVVLGVVSEADILAKEQGPDEERKGFLGWLLDTSYADVDRLGARTAGEAMSTPVITIGPGKQVYEAARLMTERGVKRLPVVDTSGKLIGMVTRSDLVRAFARTDDDIEREIDELLSGTLWIEPATLQIDVKDGEVAIRGTLERRSDAELLPRFVARIPGVIAVEADVTWQWDDRMARLESNPRIPVPPRW